MPEAVKRVPAPAVFLARPLESSWPNGFLPLKSEKASPCYQAAMTCFTRYCVDGFCKLVLADSRSIAHVCTWDSKPASFRWGVPFLCCLPLRTHFCCLCCIISSSYLNKFVTASIYYIGCRVNNDRGYCFSPMYDRLFASGIICFRALQV